MRFTPLTVFLLASFAVAGCSVAQQLLNGGSTPAPAADGGADPDAAAADSAVSGAGCGVDSNSGAELCVATTLCPTVVVDTTAFPHCGFRIKAGSSELVCGCGESICSMGPFTTCAQAASLLMSQTEASVCAQVGSGGCTAGTPSTSSSTSSGGGPTCDHTCLQECGSGAGCASVCGCM